MIRSTIKTPFTINLDGQQGNVYYLLGIVPYLIRQLQSENLKEKEIVDQMMSSNYYNAVLTFDKYFGNYIILETNNQTLLDLFEEQKDYKSIEDCDLKQI